MTKSYHWTRGRTEAPGDCVWAVSVESYPWTPVWAALECPPDRRDINSRQRQTFEEEQGASWAWPSRDTSPRGPEEGKQVHPKIWPRRAGAAFENKGKGERLEMRGREPVLFRTPSWAVTGKLVMSTETVCLKLRGHSEELLTGRQMVLATVSWQKQQKSGACFPNKVLLSSPPLNHPCSDGGGALKGP